MEAVANAEKHKKALDEHSNPQIETHIQSSSCVVEIAQGKISHETDIIEFTFKNVTNSELSSTENDKTYLICQSGQVRFINGAFPLIYNPNDETKLPGSISTITVIHGDCYWPQDLLLIRTVDMKFELRDFVFSKGSKRERVLDSIPLPTECYKCNSSIILQATGSKHLIYLWESSNSVSIIFFEIEKRLSSLCLNYCDQQLMLPRSESLSAAMYNHGEVTTTLLLIWNCQRICLILTEWKNINEDKDYYRLVFPQLHSGKKIIVLNPNYFLLNADDSSFLISASQIRSGDCHLRYFNDMFSSVLMSSQHNSLIHSLNNVQEKFEHCTLVLLENSMLCGILSTNLGEFNYFPIIKIKNVKKFYISDISDGVLKVDLVSSRGIERVSLQLSSVEIHSTGYDFEINKDIVMNSQILYENYDGDTSLLKIQKDENLWTLGPKGISNIDKNGYQIQNTAELLSFPILNYSSKLILLDLQLESNNYLCHFFDVEKGSGQSVYVTALINQWMEISLELFSINNSDNIVQTSGLKPVVFICNEMTVTLFGIGNMFVQVTPTGIYAIRSTGNPTRIFKSLDTIYSAIPFPEREEIVVTSVSNDDLLKLTLISLSPTMPYRTNEHSLKLPEEKHLIRQVSFRFIEEELQYYVLTENYLITCFYDQKGYFHGKISPLDELNCFSSFVDNIGILSSRNGNNIYSHSLANPGTVSNLTEGIDLYFGHDPCRIQQVSESCLLIYDTYKAAIVKDGQMLRIQTNNSSEANLIYQVEAIIDLGEVSLLFILYENCLKVLRGTNVSNQIKRIKLNRAENNTKCCNFLSHINRMIIYDCKKQLVYALKLQTGKIAPIKYANIDEFIKIYHLSEVSILDHLSKKRSYVVMIGCSKKNMVSLKLCQLCFKSGKLYMKPVNTFEIPYADKDKNHRLPRLVVSKSVPDSNELWISTTYSVQLISVDLQHICKVAEYKTLFPINTISISASLIMISSQTNKHKTALLPELERFGARALVDMLPITKNSGQDEITSAISSANPASTHSAIFHPSWLAIFGDQMDEGHLGSNARSGIVCLLQTNRHGYVEEKYLIRTARNPADMARTHDGFVLLHLTGVLTTLTLNPSVH